MWSIKKKSKTYNFDIAPIKSVIQQGSVVYLLSNCSLCVWPNFLWNVSHLGITWVMAAERQMEWTMEEVFMDNRLQLLLPSYSPSVSLFVSLVSGKLKYLLLGVTYLPGEISSLTLRAWNLHINILILI